MTWRYGGQRTGCAKEVDERTKQLEENIKQCMEAVAPMRFVKEKESKPAWITEELLEGRRERERKRQIAKKTGHCEDFRVWRLLRNKVNRDLKKARKKHLERGLQDKMTFSASLHKGIAEFLGWREAGEPTTLLSYRMVRRKVEDQNTGGGSSDEGEVAGTKQANLEHTAPQNTALARRVAGLGGEEDSSQKAFPPAQPQWWAISGEGGSIQYVLVSRPTSLPRALALVHTHDDVMASYFTPPALAV